MLEIYENKLLGEKYYKTVHKSGLTVYVYPKTRSTAFVMLTTRYGSLEREFSLEGDAGTITVPDGVAHFLEHKLFEEEDGSDAFEMPSKVYSEQSPDVERFVEELIEGTTFPKFAMNCRVNFSIEGISRICLAQLTRDSAFFCSESHGLRPLSQEFNIPLNIYNDESIMNKVRKAQELIEEAYIEACEKEYPYPETRYICLHSQTISLTASYTLADFARACYSRTNNSFCDELNYVYRKMFYALSKAISRLTDSQSRDIYKWLINEKKCIDDNYYKRTNVFNSDFSPAQSLGRPCFKPAQNDWRKSCWKMELERIFLEEPHLLTARERSEIEDWMQKKDKFLKTTYDDKEERVAKNAIKKMPYYKSKEKKRV